MHLTRTTACLMSLFGADLLLVPFLLLVMAARASQANGGAHDVLGLIGMLLFVAAIVSIRFYFARWYARDKGQHVAWGIAGVFGFLGWVMLWRLTDRNQSNKPEPIATLAQQDGAPDAADGAPVSNGALLSASGRGDRKDLWPTRFHGRFAMRVLVLGDIALTVAGVAAEVILEETLPEPVRMVEASRELPTALLIAGSILLLFMAVSWVALWRFWSRAHILYAATCAGFLAAGLFTGYHISTAVGETFGSISSVVTGAILALAFLSPLREEFTRRPTA
jgi:hypothetical protein